MDKNWLSIVKLKTACQNIPYQACTIWPSSCSLTSYQTFLGTPLFDKYFLSDWWTEFNKKNHRVAEWYIINKSVKYLRDWIKIGRVLSNSKHYVKNAVLKEHSLIPVYAQCGLHLPPPLNDTVFSTCCFEFDHTRPICNQSLSYVADLLMIPYGYSTNLF